MNNQNSSPEVREALKLLEALKQKQDTNRMSLFKPYPKQKEFLDSTKKTKALIAGNQVGKSTTACFELACHLTGIYPAWWNGVRYERPVMIWAASETTTRTRDTIQCQLFGDLGRLGTGLIPKDKIEIDTIVRKSGIPLAIDIGYIKHKSGGLSSIQFFSYDMGREKFQGSTIDIMAFDEEPPSPIVSEAKMRLIAKSGRLMYTFTPLSGITPLYDSMMQDPNVFKVHMSWDDVDHISKSDQDRLTEGMDASEIQARKFGIASSSCGQIFKFQSDEYICDSFDIPSIWPKIGGLDVGISHPTGAVALAIDRNTKTIYVYREYEANNKTAVDHSRALRCWNMKFAMDPSAWNRQIGTAISVAKIYQDEGLSVFKANNDRETSIHKIRSMISQGKLWILSSCPKLIKQMRTYRTNDAGVVIKVDDDLIDPLRYAIMSIDRAEAFNDESCDRNVEIVEWNACDKRIGY